MPRPPFPYSVEAPARAYAVEPARRVLNGPAHVLTCIAKLDILTIGTVIQWACHLSSWLPCLVFPTREPTVNISARSRPLAVGHP